jgi:hypothetical protein
MLHVKRETDCTIQTGRHFLIDHKWLFLFGYLFYFITPLVVGETALFKGFPGIELYMGFYNRIPAEKIQLYIIITLCWLPAFFLGHFFFSLFKPYKLSLQQFPSTPVTRIAGAGIGFVCLFITCFHIWRLWLL